MKNTTRKAFTIVELVIVIAIIAVLAAVLVPTFVNLIKVAHVSSDTQLVRNLNTALAVDNQEHKTMQSALDAAAAAGYDVKKINATATGNEILWDSANDLFCYLEADAERPIYIPESTLTISNPTDVQYWRITGEDKYLRGSDAKYSVYYTGTSTAITTTVGFDAGTTTGITAVTYDRSTATDDREVVIRTNSYDTVVTINAPTDTVRHYDKANKIDITAVASASYHEYGELLGKITLYKGHVVIGSTATVSVIDVKATAAADIKIDIPESQAVVVMADTAGVVTDENTKGAIVPESDKVICSLTTKQGYSTMEEAVADGGNLVLLRDYTYPNTVGEFVLAPTGKAVKIDLNGYTLTTARQINVYGSLVINGNGKISFDNSNASWALCVNNSADLVINAGNKFTVESNVGILTASAFTGTITLR